jgi:hypothetical protein
MLVVDSSGFVRNRIQPGWRTHMADDSAELVINGESRRVGMDIMKLQPKASAGEPKTPGQETAIDGEIHDQEDLSAIEDAVLRIDGVGEFKVNFYSPTRFRGDFLRPWSSEALHRLGEHANESGTAHE